jgi:hypothetical protein
MTSTSGGELPDIADLVVDRLRGTTAQDSHGNDQVDWSNPSVLTIAGCWIGQPSGIELANGRQTVIDTEWWWGPQAADVISTDRIRDVETGITYDIITDVRLIRDPDQGEYTHKTCQLKAVTG